jgi:hypothetical protein
MTFWTSAELEPKKSYQYYVSFSAIADPFLIKGVTLPSFELGTIEADYTQYKFNYPGKMSWSPVEFTIYDVVGDQSTAKKLMKLLKAAGAEQPTKSTDRTTLSKQKISQAVGDIKIVQVDTAGNQIGTWTLKSPFITAANFGTQGYSDESLIEVTCTVTYDWADYS